MTEKIWKTIEGWDRYEVSTDGEIRNKKNGKMRKPVKMNNGYLGIELTRNEDGKCVRKMFLLHRIVAMTFLENPEGYREVNHIDEDKYNNKVENLEWCSRSHNMNHGHVGGKISRKLSGMKRSEETRQKMRDSWKNRKPKQKTTPKKYKKPVLQYDLDGNFIKEYPSVYRAGLETGVNSSNIYSTIRGEHRSCGGFLWRFK